MAPGGPPGSGRGRGGKFRNYTRGGGKHFSRDLRPLDAHGNEVKRENDNESSSEDEEESSEEEESDAEGSQVKNLSREERRAAAKAKKLAAIAKKNGHVVEAGDMPSSSEGESDDEPMPANPNHSKASRNQTRVSLSVEETTNKVKDLSVGSTTKAKPVAELSRREREAIQTQQAKERYQKLHEAGKTDEAKADLARLKLIREKREAEAARKKAEKEEREEAEKTKKAELNAREAKRREAALGSTKGKGSSKR